MRKKPKTESDKRFIPYVIDGGKSRLKPKPSLKVNLDQVENSARLIDLFLVQLRAQMRALVASDTIDMMGLCELVTDEVENLIKENYPHADA